MTVCLSIVFGLSAAAPHPRTPAARALVLLSCPQLNHFGFSSSWKWGRGGQIDPLLKMSPKAVSVGIKEWQP